jgi:ribosomal protein L7/L12
VAIREKGGMWCPSCQRPVAGRKTGHAVRNTLGAAATLGLSLKSERWHCPVCGGPVEKVAFRKVTATAPVVPDDQASELVTVTLVDPGPKLIQAIKVHRKITRAGLREAKAAMEAVPTVVGRFTPEAAKQVRASFESAGAAVRVDAPTAEPVTVESGESISLTAELARLAELHSAGALTAEEFAAAKAKAIESSPAVGGSPSSPP